jgi:hypothetical protein
LIFHELRILYQPGHKVMFCARRLPYIFRWLLLEPRIILLGKRCPFSHFPLGLLPLFGNLNGRHVPKPFTKRKKLPVIAYRALT